jgi:hypothetical protein
MANPNKVPSGNDAFVKAQRNAINEYLMNQVITNHANPRATRSFYWNRPVDDPDAEAIYELASGDPTLNALLSYTHEAELDLDSVLQNESDPIVRQREAMKVRANIEHLQLLEDQYRYPHEYPLTREK